MMLSKLGRPFKSIFTKLLVVMLIVGFCINLTVFVFFFKMHRVRIAKPIKSNIVQYLRYFLNDLGSPPNLSRAKELATRLSLQIRYKGLQGSWTTSPKLPSIEKALMAAKNKEEACVSPQLGFEAYVLDGNLMQRRGPGQHLILIHKQNDTFLIALADYYYDKKEIHKLVGTLIIILTLLTVATYLIVRKILKPIKLLTQGVHQVHSGDLDCSVPVLSSDELGEMTQAFNDMTERIRKMLKAREQLLLDVSHELRSPITRMKLSLEFLSENKFKEKLTEDVIEMEIMVTDILENARLRNQIRDLKKAPRCINRLIKSVTEHFKDHPPGIVFKELSKDIMIPMDEAQIKTVIKNLLENALKYSPTSTKPVEIEAFVQKNRLHISIRDFGIGIDPKDLPYVFEPFYRADKSRSKATGGYGLGLNLCKTIVLAHQGEIKIGSALNQGTTVSFFLPLNIVRPEFQN